MLGKSSSWRYSRQLPIWNRKISSLSAALKPAPGAAAAASARTRNVSSQSALCSQTRAATADIEGRQAAMDADGQSLGEAATARPFSDIPGE